MNPLHVAHLPKATNACELCKKKTAEYKINNVEKTLRWVHVCPRCFLKDKEFWKKYEAILATPSN